MKIDKPTPGAPCWVELGTSDVAAAKEFYGSVFGWRAETDPREEAGGYTMLYLDDEPVAAMTPLYAPDQPVSWMVSFATEDADATAEAAAAAGGTVLMPAMDVFELGRFAVIAGPDGAAFSIWQARSFSGAGVLNENGALCWVELTTRDPGAARAFYPDVFGWTVAGEGYPHFSVGGQEFGGMMEMPAEVPAQVPSYWLPYFAVADVDAAVTAITGQGGAVHVGPIDVPGTGRISVVTDPQGATLGLYREAR